MKLTILGVGTFFVNTNRSSSAYLLEADNKKILIDCGPGTLMRLSQIGITPADLDYIFITHFHADHTSDLFPLFMNLRLLDFYPESKLTKFPQIIGPKGIYKFMLKLSNAYQLPAVINWEKVELKDIKPSQQIGNIKVNAYKVKHNAFGIFAKAHAYRFSCEGKTIAFSGDTVRCTGIEKACKNADIFLCDGSYSKGNANAAHLDTKDIGEICQKSKVKKVILCHQYPQYDNVNLVSEVKEFFSGEIVKGKDLMELTI
jgi:ribonuclease BN (tRNA processing enzyme)